MHGKVANETRSHRLYSCRISRLAKETVMAWKMHLPPSLQMAYSCRIREPSGATEESHGMENAPWLARETCFAQAEQVTSVS